MSEEVQAQPLLFTVTADKTGLVELQMSQDMDFVIRTYIGIGDFIRSHLDPKPELATFLADLANIVVAAQKFAVEREANRGLVQ